MSPRAISSLLRIPSGQVLDRSVLPVPEADEAQKFLDPRIAVRWLHLMEPAMVLKVLCAGEVDIEVQHLRHHADRPLDAREDRQSHRDPATDAVPDVGDRSVVSMRIVVVFPAPFGPRRPKTSPLPTVKLIDCTAPRVPKYLVRLRVSIMNGLKNRMYSFSIAASLRMCSSL